MRVDFVQGDHLRLGRLVIARNRHAAPQPLLDGATVRLERVDHLDGVMVAASSVIAYAEVRNDIDHPNRVQENFQQGAPSLIPPPVWVIPDRQLRHLSEAVARADGTHEVEHFGGWCLTRGSWSWTAGWKDLRPPNPYRWRWRFVRAALGRRWCDRFHAQNYTPGAAEGRTPDLEHAR